MVDTPPEEADSGTVTANADPDGNATADTSDTDDSLVRAVIGMGHRPAPVRLVPEQIVDDTYRIVSTLGAGGMGVVYLARDIRLGRDVAIKLHATGSNARGVERLIREASAIAQLSHVNVVTVYKVDTYDGHPFVAMEYVDGGTARSWQRAQPRSWRETLALYLGAGRGLAAAHHAGLVHRDFKPDNVLVGNDGRVRVADFGLVQGDVPSSSETREASDDSSDVVDAPLTRTGTVMGTPAYMAPEQHHARAVGPAADQFSFCVSLWEALYGARPFFGAGSDEIVAAIEARRFREPAADRKVPRHVRRALERGLSADPDARFSTMDALLAELARDPAALRRRLLIAATALVGGGAAATLVFALRGGAHDGAARCGDGAKRLVGVWDDARRDAIKTAFLATGKPHAAETFARTSAQLARYATDWAVARDEACKATHQRHDQSAQLLDLRYHCLDQRRADLDALVTVFAAGPDPAVLDRAIDASRHLPDLAACDDIPTLSGAPPLPGDPAVRADITRIGASVADANAMVTAGKFVDGVTLATKTVAQARATGYAPLTAQALRTLAALQSAAGDHVAAKATAREAALAAAAAHDDRGAAQTWMFLLHVVATQTNEIDEAESLVPVTEAAVTRAGNSPDLRVELDSIVGVLRQAQGRYPEARQLLEGALALSDRELGPDADVSTTLNRLANVLARQDALDDSRRYLERAIALQERTLGPEHPYLAMSLHNLGGVLYRMGDYEGALAVFERSLAMKQKLLGADHRDLASTESHIGVTLRALGRFREARPHLEHSLAIAEATFGPDHPSVPHALLNLAGVVGQLDGPREALPMFERGLALLEKARGPNHPELADILIELGNTRSSAGDHAGARRDLERARRILEASVGPEHADVAAVLGSLADLAVNEGKLDEARRTYDRSLAITIKSLGDHHPQVAKIQAAMGFLAIESRDFEAARRHFADAQTLIEATRGTDHPEYARCLFGLARVDLLTQKDADAQAKLERAVAITEKASGKEHPNLAEPLTYLAQAHFYQGHAAEALAAAKRAAAIYAANPKDPRGAAEARFVLAQARWLAGDNRKAALDEARAARADLAVAGAPAADLAEFDRWLRDPQN